MDASSDSEVSDYPKARNYALRRLSASAYLSHDLRAYLKRKEFSAVSIDRVIEELSDLGYLDDQAWLNSYVRRKLAARQGLTKIRQALMAKKVPESEIEAAFSRCEELDDTQQQQAVRELLERKYANRDLNDWNERGKVVAALLRKGFHMEDVRAVIDGKFSCAEGAQDKKLFNAKSDG